MPTTITLYHPGRQLSTSDVLKDALNIQ